MSVSELAASRIKEFREKHLKLSLTEFSKDVGIDEDKLRQIENGDTEADLDDLADICHAYRVSCNYFIGFEDEIQTVPLTDEEIIGVTEYMKTLPHEELLKLRDNIHSILKKQSNQ